MFHYLLKKTSRYLLFLAFAIPVLGFISLAIQTKQFPIEDDAKKVKSVVDTVVEKASKEKSVEDTLLDIATNEAEQAYVQNIIYLDNFPVKNGKLSSRYGMRKDPFSGKRRMHRGIDIKAKRGSDVFPIGTGTVIFSGRKPGFGKIIEIQHGRTIVSRYAHLKKSFVKKGQIVKKTDVIAQVGNTGRSTGPHLHLEVVINDKTVDPKIFMIGGLARN